LTGGAKMNLQQQMGEFRRLLADFGASVDDFELQIAGEGFRTLISGGAAELEVGCRSTGVVRVYRADGSPAWLAQFSADLHGGVFAGGSGR